LIVIIIVRRCVCELCNKLWDLEWGDEPPEKCPHCGSVNWEDAPEIRDAIYIRKGITKAKRRLNPGAKSRKRQEQGRKQWQAFKQKPVDSPMEPG
jgi:phage FluMu protein Com